MEKLLIEAGKSFPTLIVTVAVMIFVMYVIREYRKIRSENEESIRALVNAKMGDFYSEIQSETSRLETIVKNSALKLDQVENMYLNFMEDVDKKSKEIDELYSGANEKLLSLKQAIPNVDEHSARDILALAQGADNSQQKAEFCKHILAHEDATSKDLELAGDIMKKSNRYSLALSLYEKSYNADPERIESESEYLSLRARLDHKKRNESLSLAKTRVIEKPTSSTAFSAIANALMELSRYEELSQFSSDFAQVVGDRKPKLKALALRNMGVAYRQSGDLEKSIDAFNEALSIFPDDENTLKPYLGVLEDQGKEDEYLVTALKLIETDPLDINYYRIYVSSLIKNKRYQEAQEWISKADQIPKSPMDEHVLGVYKMKAHMAANNSMQPTSATLRSTDAAD